MPPEMKSNYYVILSLRKTVGTIFLNANMNFPN